MADKEKEKDGNYPYALNSIGDILHYDPTRLLDLGNVFQVLISQNKPETNEEARALTNFEKLTEDSPRPISHTLTDAIRLLPDVLTFATAPIKKGVKAGVKKVLTKATGNKPAKIASTLVGEGTTDAAKAFNRSKLLSKGSKDTAAKAWVRELYENEDAMHRIAGRKLSPAEVESVKKELPGAISEKIKVYNEDVDAVKDIYKKAKRKLEVKNLYEKAKDPTVTAEGLYKLAKKPQIDWTENLNTYRKYLVDDSKVLNEFEWQKLARNISELPEFDRRAKFSHINADTLLKGIPKDKHKAVKDVLLNSVKGLTLPAPTANLVAKGFDAGFDLGKIKRQTNNELEMDTDYWTQGSDPTPVSDFFASVFNVDFDDPARFNKKDIDAFFEFLEDIGTIEPGIKDKWTPRQKVSVMREMMSNKGYGSYIKDRWANSKHRENWIKSYSGE